MNRAIRSILLITASSLAAQPPERGPLEITSGLGRKLYALPDNAAVIEARKNLAADPKNPDLVLKLSKAQAGRRQYKEAVATDTQGLTFAPKNADLYLERGHRELGLREFKPAMKDLEQAVHLAPDNLDNYYHLGLSHYFLGEFSKAAASFEKARSSSQDKRQPHRLFQLALCLTPPRWRPRHKAAKALERITPEVKNAEPHLLFYLRLLHFYQGQLTAEQVLPPPPTGPTDTEGELSFNTVNYGVGNWRLYNGKGSDAVSLFKKVVNGEAWNSWGFVGSEVELVRGVKTTSGGN